MRLDLLADRPDLFDVGGLARALRGTLGIESGLPKYDTKPSGLTVKVDKSVTDKSSYRPFIACAVMTLPPVDETSLVAIMKLQENLHWGVGRDRKLASIGVYDHVRRSAATSPTARSIPTKIRSCRSACRARK